MGGCGCHDDHERHSHHRRRRHHHRKRYHTQEECKVRRREQRFRAVLSEANEVPPVPNGPARGRAKALLSRDRHTLAFFVEFEHLSSSVQEPGPGLGWAHFHLGAAGVNGPIVKDITCDLKLTRDKRCGRGKGEWDCSDEMSLTPELVAALQAGEIYVNIHTVDYPGGELRGQLLLEH